MNPVWWLPFLLPIGTEIGYFLLTIKKKFQRIFSIFLLLIYFDINLQIKPPLSVESSIMWKKSPNQMKILNIRDCLLSLSIISFPPEKKKPKTCQFWSEYAKTDARALIWCPPGICTWKGHRILTRCKLLPNILREKIRNSLFTDHMLSTNLRSGSIR